MSAIAILQVTSKPIAIVKGSSALGITKITRYISTVSRGKDGIAGASGSQTVTYNAASNLSGHRAVVLDSSSNATYADNTNLAHKDIILGITTGAATTGNPATIQTYGEITEPSWAWSPEDTIYLSTNGLITNIPPSSGFLIVLGFAITATKIFLTIKLPIVLN